MRAGKGLFIRQPGKVTADRKLLLSPLGRDEKQSVQSGQNQQAGQNPRPKLPTIPRRGKK